VNVNRTHQSITTAWRGIATAGLIVITVSALSGAVNGWAIGHYESYILQKQARAREAPGGMKRYVWVKTLPFALPLALGGLVALRLVRRRTAVHGLTLVAILLPGAIVGWLTARVFGALAADDWSPQIQSTLLLPSILFVIVPAAGIVKDRLA